MNIGIVCYASVGGSGIVATELGRALAGRKQSDALGIRADQVICDRDFQDVGHG